MKIEFEGIPLFGFAIGYDDELSSWLIKEKGMIQKGWAIYGEHGLYTGWEFTRTEAIQNHCKALGKDWRYCRRKGDRAVKVEITIIIL
jgi:hypothetical protein